MITADDVWDEMGLGDAVHSPADESHMASVVPAVNANVVQTVVRVRELPEGDPWPDDVHQGAVILAARLFARRNSPTGVAAFTDAGPAYIARYDPDIERMFGTGSWSAPAIG